MGRRMTFLRSLLLAVLVTLVMALNPLTAQTLVSEFEADDAGNNVLMNADSLIYDKNFGTVTASGNVEISLRSKGGRDSVPLDQAVSRVKAALA